MRTILITGANRGLGLELAKKLATDADTQVVLAVRDRKLGDAAAASIGRNATVRTLDMASRSSIQQFVQDWDVPLNGLINNAGLQNTSTPEFTDDGFETTLAVNHLAPLELTLGLLPYLQNGTVMGVGSGTHNPDDRVAKLFGFRGGRFSSIADLAKGEMDAKSNQQAGLDRYATSKLLFMATAPELARRYEKTRFVTLDPGLMPGTGLARSAPAPIRWVWNNVMPLFVPLVSGASTPTKSAAAGKKAFNDPQSKSGQIFDHHGRATDNFWDKVNDVSFGKEVVDQSLALLGLNPDR